jgi:hypothetical protein
MTRNFIVLCLMLQGIVSTSVNAQDDPQREKRFGALNELSGELLECSVYFRIASECVKGHPDAGDLPKQLEIASRNIGTLAVSTGRSLGVSDDAYVARMKMKSRSLMAQLSGNCVNISVLMERYQTFCVALHNNADPRLVELMKGKKCGGSYLGGDCR